MDRIKYFCYYNFMDGKAPRQGVLAASTKIDYIVSVINRLGLGVDIISRTPVTTPNFCFDSGGTIQLGENTLRHFISLGYRKSIIRIVDRWLTNLHLILWFLINVRRGEQIIVYHSLGYCKLIRILSKIKNCKLIGEIEEIFQDVHPQSKRLSKDEYNFVESCDGYIFPTGLLNSKFNKGNKPFAIVNGVYKSTEIVSSKFSDGKIHVVYGGTFDPKKGGAIAAIESALYLTDKYVLHICGFGTTKDTEDVKQLVDETNGSAKCKVIFEGLLNENAYNLFIQKCHIGLSTQNPAGKFSDTSFPSKILIYLANNLKVVSIKIPVVTTCAVVDGITFYDEQTPEQIAAAIMNICLNTDDIPSLLKHADLDFEHQIRGIL